MMPHIKQYDGESLETAFNMQIPQCCREGDPNCPHVEKKRLPRRNIAL